VCRPSNLMDSATQRARYSRGFGVHRRFQVHSHVEPSSGGRRLPQGQRICSAARPSGSMTYFWAARPARSAGSSPPRTRACSRRTGTVRPRRAWRGSGVADLVLPGRRAVEGVAGDRGDHQAAQHRAHRPVPHGRGGPTGGRHRGRYGHDGIALALGGRRQSWMFRTAE